MYSTILIPTDLANHELTIKALQKADKLTENGRIVLLHVLEDIPAFALIELSMDLVEEQIPKSRELLAGLVAKSGIKADIEILKGPAHNKIIEEATTIGADLILINSHQPEFKDYLLGSTAARVVRHAPCSVLVER